MEVAWQGATGVITRSHGGTQRLLKKKTDGMGAHENGQHLSVKSEVLTKVNSFPQEDSYEHYQAKPQPTAAL